MAPKKLKQKDNKEINRLRSLFPKNILVRAGRSVDGGFYAEILDFPGSFTEADTFSELIEMVNNAMCTIFDVPKDYLSFMPSYSPPIEIAGAFNIFPVKKIEEKIRLILPSENNREKVNC